MRHALRPPTPNPSFPGNLDPRWKLAAISIAVSVTVLLQTVAAASMALLLAFFLAAAVRVPLRRLAVRVLVVALFLAAFTIWLPFSFPDHGPSWTFGPMTVSAYGLTVAARLWCKALAVVTLVLVLTNSSPSPTVAQAAHALRAPDVLVQLISLTHRYAILAADEFGRLRVALRVRGYRNRSDFHSYRTVGNVAGILLIRGLERAERVSQAMRCRGFDGRFRSLHAFRTRRQDIVAFLAIVLSVGCILTYDIARR